MFENYQLVILVSAVLGLIVGYSGRIIQTKLKQNSVEVDIKEKIINAEEKALKIIENAEAKAEKIESEARADRKSTEEKLQKKEERLLEREDFLDNRQIDIDSQKEAIEQKIHDIKTIRQALADKEKDTEQELERIGNLSKTEAIAEIIKKTEADYSDDLLKRIHKLQTASDSILEEKALNILLSVVQRVGNSFPVTHLTTSIEIPSEEIKGKVIGKEGRNIRTFERVTGVDVLVDETPGYITLSSFDPIRREIASQALQELIKDGRIQPAKIEEFVQDARTSISKRIRKYGEQAVYDTNVQNLEADLITILGRLYFRTSYGQNVLQHSIEVAHISGMLAEELGLNVGVARAGGLLHDIGKTMSHEVAGSHVDIGIRILQKFNVDENVIKAMQSHHDEYPYEIPEAVIVQVADALSASRPGARKDSVENYVKRLSELEAVAKELQGVESAFAIAAGREIRVLVNPTRLNEYQANALAKTIATNIESRLRYPGEIKVHVIRETRVISYAR